MISWVPAFKIITRERFNVIEEIFIIIYDENVGEGLDVFTLLALGEHLPLKFKN